MDEATIPLPDDLAVCHGMIRELAASLRAAQRQVEQLGHRLDLLLRRLYGPRSERVDPDQRKRLSNAACSGVARIPLAAARWLVSCDVDPARGADRISVPRSFPVRLRRGGGGRVEPDHGLRLLVGQPQDQVV